MRIRYKPAKRAGGWGSLFFTLLGGKEGQVSKIVIVVIIVIIIIVMIIMIMIIIIVGKVMMPTNADYDYHFQSRIGKKQKTPVRFCI